MAAVIISPTRISTDAVADAGIARNMGDSSNARKKHVAVVRAVRPLRPPSLTPAALSTSVVTVLVPIIAPAVVPMASTMNAFLSPRGLFSSIRPLPYDTPNSVPMVSKRSTNRNVNTTMSMSIVKILSHSNLRKMGSIEGGVLSNPVYSVMPIGMPMIVVARMPNMSAPFTL